MNPHFQLSQGSRDTTPQRSNDEEQHSFFLSFFVSSKNYQFYPQARGTEVLNQEHQTEELLNSR